MDYIPGVSINKYKNNSKFSGSSKVVEEVCSNIIKQIHEKSVFISDLERRNIVYYENEFYFVDFGDSIDCSMIPEFYFRMLKKLDIMFFEQRVIRKLLK